MSSDPWSYVISVGLEYQVNHVVETTWLTRYSRPTEITYDQGSELIDYEFRKYLTEMENGIIANPITSGDPNSNSILE